VVLVDLFSKRKTPVDRFQNSKVRGGNFWTVAITGQQKQTHGISPRADTSREE
jgi:hypothetical protein